MWLAAVRDVAIVLLALETLVIGVLLALTLIQIRRLVRLLRDEIRPMLDSANETFSTVQGTANFVSDTVVNPVIKATSYSAGTWRALQSLLFIGRRAARHSSDDGEFRSSID
jgi:hypothetical protein